MKYDFKSFLVVKSQYGDELRAYCPFHSDKNPSFSANTVSGLWKCHAGCGQGNFLQFLDLIASDPFSTLRTKTSTGTKSYARDEGFKPVAKYEYLDTLGRIHLRVIRQENSMGEKMFFQMHLDNCGCWVKGGAVNDIMPYLIQNWSKSSSKLLFFVEGEKCADFLSNLGLNSTTIPGGVNGWSDIFVRFFKDMKVVILPDNDEVGLEFGSKVHYSIAKYKIAEVHILKLPGLGKGGDIVDWLSQNKTVDDLLKLIPQ